MAKLIAKVDAMDSKLDQILSLLLSGPGHDAKKGEKQSNPDDPDEMILMMFLRVVGDTKKRKQLQPLMLLRHYRSSLLMLLVLHK